MEFANIYINGQIGSIETKKGVELIDVISQVQQHKEAIGYNIFINSQGGVVDTGFQIYDYLVSLKKPINTIGIGTVASIATVVFMAGTTRKLKAGTNFIIHLPMLSIDGYVNSNDMDYIKSDLETTNKRLLDFYKKGTNLTEDALMPLLSNETNLTIEQTKNLGFTTEDFVEPKIVAYFKTQNNMNVEDKNWLETLINGAVAKFAPRKKIGFKSVALVKSEIVNIDTTDANGTIITFPDVAESTMPIVGDKATIDGTPANGEYLMPNGDTFIFIDGELTQIVVVETDTLQTEIDTLLAKLATQETAFKNEIVNLKTQITNRFTKTEPVATTDPDTTVLSVAQQRIQKLKNK